MEVKTHGGDIYSYINENQKKPIDFSANINPFGLPSGVKKILRKSVNEFTAYPDIRSYYLKKALSEFENIDKESIAVGNGAADIIYRLAYAVKPKRALLLAPTFSEYETALRNINCTVDYYYLIQENNFIVKDEILTQIKNKDILFVCNPNNPTGMLIDKDFMLKIANKCKEESCYLVIDECFIDFLENKEDYTFKSFLEDYNNVIIIKAFTKIFAMAGLRLGYCLCFNKELLYKINAANQPWSISVPAQIAGVEALKDTEYLNKTILFIKKEREYLIKKLEGLNLAVFKCFANYILFRVNKPINLYDEFYNKGFLIRKCENFIGLDESYYRIAVKSHSDNKKLFLTLKEILEGENNG